MPRSVQHDRHSDRTPSGTRTQAPSPDVAPKKPRRARRSTSAPVAPESWNRMVAEAAYFRAERRGFLGGSPEEDWFAAEAELRASRRT